MSKQPLKHLKNEEIEDVTANRVREYEAKAGVTVKMLVRIENIKDRVVGVEYERNVIEEQNGQ